MRLVSPLLKHAVYPALHYAGLLDRFAPPGGYAVVNYHGVVPSDHADSDSFLDGNLVRPDTIRSFIPRTSELGVNLSVKGSEA
jgi:hypothetical protein